MASQGITSEIGISLRWDRKMISTVFPAFIRRLNGSITSAIPSRLSCKGGTSSARAAKSSAYAILLARRGQLTKTLSSNKSSSHCRRISPYTKLNMGGESMSPSRTPRFTGNDSDKKPSILRRHVFRWKVEARAFTNGAASPNRCKRSTNLTLSTDGKAFLISIKTQKTGCPLPRTNTDGRRCDRSPAKLLPYRNRKNIGVLDEEFYLRPPWNLYILFISTKKTTCVLAITSASSSRSMYTGRFPLNNLDVKSQGNRKSNYVDTTMAKTRAAMVLLPG